MVKAVRLSEYGDVNVLTVEEVDQPAPAAGQVLVRVKAAGINPGEATIRRGLLHERWPSTFPSGQGSDLAGVVTEVGPEVSTVDVGDEVIGFTHQRASHAEFVLVEAENLTPRPSAVSWEAAGALFVAGTTAYAAVAAVALNPGDTVAVSGAAGGVGSLVVQLAKNAGATVIGIASESNHQWLVDHGVIPVAYGDGVADRITAVAGGKKIDAFVDTYGADYIELALGLGVQPDRINTIINFADAQKYGTKTDGNGSADSAAVLAELAELIAAGKLDLPIARVYPLDQVREAFQELEKRHTRGKIVLQP
ncbi:NADP-dependent oxidoreductase [Fodinicola feengrottensis]|uniref:NADP-dependent oxidoreductase n=1 Tax=Fodinicola feengrottensis TaxID=435914 RepID=A0ABP4V1A1_9ACTN